ncbi:MAG: phenylalanine--tRNA ligase subunit alpha, partial [Dehalococcoidales bacterium]|nr:phenylalanine--tRNA ligase subunit alpha [Dehalococcoidales bacterium]
MMLKQIDEMKIDALQQLEGITHIKDLDAWRVHYLGKKSPLTGILRGLAALPMEDRKAAGAAANVLKNLLEESFRQKEQSLRETELTTQAQKETIDITLPGRPLPAGRRHPLTQTLEEICDIFYSMGFQIATGPEVEWDYYNFEALNIPAEHPARDT